MVRVWLCSVIQEPGALMALSDCETQNSEAAGCLLVEDQTSGVTQFTIHCFPSCSISISNLMSFTESPSNEIYMRGFVLCKSTLTEQYLKTSKLMHASHCREETLREKDIMYVVGCMCVCVWFVLVTPQIHKHSKRHFISK